jgi:hypothetical protein
MINTIILKFPFLRYIEKLKLKHFKFSENWAKTNSYLADKNELLRNTPSQCAIYKSEL